MKKIIVLALVVLGLLAIVPAMELQSRPGVQPRRHGRGWRRGVVARFEANANNVLILIDNSAPRKMES